MQIIAVPNRQITPSQVADFEALLQRKLPDDYRSFLLEFNGGEAEENGHPAPPPVDIIGVTFFFGILDAEVYGDIRYMSRQMMHRIPENIVPIADCEGGNLIGLSLRSDSYGHVFFWDHEGEADEDEPATFANMVKVSSSFEQFCEGFRPPEPLVVPPNFKIIRVRNESEIKADLSSRTRSRKGALLPSPRRPKLNATM